MTKYIFFSFYCFTILFYRKRSQFITYAKHTLNNRDKHHNNFNEKNIKNSQIH